jgi:cyclophilin family peptidyl-prolyl cis-trans isomerase
VGTDKRQRQKAYRDAQRAALLAQQKRRRNLRIAAGAAAAVLVAIVLVVTLAGNGKKGSAGATSASCPKSGNTTRKLTFTSAPPTCLAKGTKASVTFVTTKGDVVVQLDTTNTPETANNFAFLAGWHYYDNTKLFRVDSSIDIIQGGSPHTEDNSDAGPGYSIKDEPAFSVDPSTQQLKGPYRYKAGDLVMARTSNANSAGAQFFFVTGPNGSNLDSQGTYVTFGHVTKGLDVLQAIMKAPSTTDPGGLGQTPNPPIVVKKVTVTTS